jgi:osmotically-inducible protein OsmY
MHSILLALVVSFVPIAATPRTLGSERSLNQVENRQEPQRKTPAHRDSGASNSALAAEIRHELLMLPYYDVFDWLEGEVQDGRVVLRGEVTRPTIKSAAESRVKQIEGVEQIDNQIQVLPVSSNDDRLRIALYRSIFNFNSPLFRYATRSVPPIHIIVNRGRATLKGVVATEMDRQLAYTKARSVPGLFDVQNELRVERSPNK